MYDQKGDEIEGVERITVEFKYGQTITPPTVSVLDGYEYFGFETSYETMPAEEIECYIIWSCLHKVVDSNDTCEACGETLECADNNEDEHCDYCRRPMDSENHNYIDSSDNNHVCDICGDPFTDLCFDNDKNSKCDVCGENHTICSATGEDHRDEDDMLHICDDCGAWMSYECTVDDEKHECTTCYARFYDLCTDEDHNCVCDDCYKMIPCVDENQDKICDNCKQCIVHVDADRNSMCEVCGQVTNCIGEGYSHYDGNYDHACDVCDVRLPYYCGDWDEDGVCDECRNPSPCQTEDGFKVHVDENNNHYCDTCNVWLLYICIEHDEDGVGNCETCGNELKCITHIDDDKNAFCDRCGNRTYCTDGWSEHDDADGKHKCSTCGVWMPYQCDQDDGEDGICDVCGNPTWCSMIDGEHHDENGDHKCDNCEVKMTYICQDADKDGRCEVCTPECDEHEINYDTHRCDICNMILPCYSEYGNPYCDICGEQIECHHEGTMDAHVCTQCYAYISSCFDEDGDGWCDLSEHSPHQVR